MTDEEKTTFPTFPRNHWWTLRKKFWQAMPNTVTAGYLAATLGMQESSAKANLLPALVAVGIIDKAGKPLERALAWRDDAQYPQVCQDIRRQIYPVELLDAFPGPEIDRKPLQTWFASRTGVGADAARKMATVYELLTEAAPTKADVSRGGTTTGARRKRRQGGQSRTEGNEPITPPDTQPERLESAARLAPERAPALHIDVQVHISSDASAEQIELIFASMAKHIYGR